MTDPLSLMQRLRAAGMAETVAVELSKALFEMDGQKRAAEAARGRLLSKELMVEAVAVAMAVLYIVAALVALSR